MIAAEIKLTDDRGACYCMHSHVNIRNKYLPHAVSAFQFYPGTIASESNMTQFPAFVSGLTNTKNNTPVITKFIKVITK